MLHPLHNPHLILHLCIVDIILHKLPLVQLLGGKRHAVVDIRHHVDGREGALADLGDAVIPVGSVPCLG